jgi:hypothetical protein
MANETELSNIIHPTDVVSDAISAALVQAVVVAPLVYSEDLPAETKVKLFRKKGSLTAEEVNESAAYAVDAAGNEYSESSVTATAVKLAAACIVTVEALRFSRLTEAELYAELGSSLGRDWDDELVAALDDGTNYVTCTAGAAMDKLLEAEYTVRRYTVGVGDGTLNAVVNYKAAHELQKDVLQSSAAVFTNPNTATILRGSTPNGFVGTIGNGMLNLYRTDGVPTTGSDDVGCVFHPQLAFATMADTTPAFNKRWLGGTDGTRGFATEYTAHMFCDVVVWNDYATCEFRSDT